MFNFSIWNRLFSKHKTTQNYIIKFRISFPQSSGTYKETADITIDIPASNELEAKEKLKKYVLAKVQVTVVEIKENQVSTMYSKPKNPQYN